MIDDEPLNREELIFLLSLHPDVEVIGAAGEASAAWQLIEDTRPNLVFLDIQMEGDSSGLDLGRRLKRLPRPPRVVFVTAHPEHALAAYDCEPDHFLVKPINDTQLSEALQRARKTLAGASQPAPPLALPYSAKNRFGETERITAYVSHHEVIFIQANPSGTVSVHLVGNEVLDGVRQTLHELEAHGFFRVHKSFLVNLARVRALKPRPGDDAYKVALTGTAEEIPVGRQRLAPLREALGEATRR
ncbi:MAG: LytTR family DNA-binding domain-containing protein [Pseudomonadota bacterium]|nr:LytTR family DNA-binding domain-containing protein [Pseudomonadota bacterium]